MYRVRVIRVGARGRPSRDEKRKMKRLEEELQAILERETGVRRMPANPFMARGRVKWF